MNYYGRHAAALASTQTRLGNTLPTITWAGKVWPIVPGSAQRRQDLASGGFQLNADFVFEALVSTFGPQNATALKASMLQTPITYLGGDYKAIQVSIKPGGQVIRVECNSAIQNA